ncbi:MAG TPA: hypothetical protein VJ183_14430 [Chloroflexia bacterium]|nr:hypothetical protein [Chloroflexia bacterium]
MPRPVASLDMLGIADADGTKAGHAPPLQIILTFTHLVWFAPARAW